MEKFNRWSDLTTGINPFVPHQRRFQGNFGVKAFQGLIGAIVCTLKLPLVTISFALVTVGNLVTSILGFIPLLGRLLTRLIEWVFCSLTLLLLGVFITEEGANTRRLGLTAPGSKGAAANSTTNPRISSGDVIVCNYTSFLEILYLAKRFSPVFAFVPEEGASKGLVHVCGLLGALKRSMSLPLSLDQSKPKKIMQVVRSASGPVVIFPEGIRSNGKSVLKFLPILEHFDLFTKAKDPLKVHLIAFRYEYKQFSPSFSAGGSLKHLLWICFHVYHRLRVTILDGNVIDLKDDANPQAIKITLRESERLRGLLAAMLRTKPVELSVQDFISFNKYWSHVTKGGKKPASAFTQRKAPHEHAQWTTNKLK